MDSSHARFFYSLAVVAFAASQAMAYRAGPPSNRTGSLDSGGDSCTQCHGSAVGSGSVEILGVPFAYTLNQTYDLTVRISDPDQLGAGFQLSVEDAIGTPVGTLSVIDAINTQLNTPYYINHTLDGVDNSVAAWAGNGNSADYQVRWQAPASSVGPITFWAAGNAINNNLNSTGDIVYLTNVTAAVPGTRPVPAASTWGLIVMAIVLMTAGTLAVARRYRPAVMRA